MHLACLVTITMDPRNIQSVENQMPTDPRLQRVMASRSELPVTPVNMAPAHMQGAFGGNNGVLQQLAAAATLVQQWNLLGGGDSSSLAVVQGQGSQPLSRVPASLPYAADSLPSSTPLSTPVWTGNVSYGAMAYPTTATSRKKQQRQQHSAPMPSSHTVYRDRPLGPPVTLSAEHKYAAPSAPPALSSVASPLLSVSMSAQSPCRDPYAPTDHMEQSHCDACDKDFPNWPSLQAHLKTHVKCAHCIFTASSRAVAKHAETAHGVVLEGSAAAARKELPSWCKIRLDTPEDLAKWIEERKKRYPTDANIARKQAEIAEKVKRGELLPTGKRLRKPNKRHLPENAFATEMGPGQEVVDAMPTKRACTADGGAAHADSQPNSEDDDDGVPPEIMSNVRPSDGGDDIALSAVQRSTRICARWRRGHCRNGDHCRFRHDHGCLPKQRRSKEEVGESQATTRNTQAHTDPQVGKPAGSRRMPLLARLLEREMRLEHSHILQCLRFIVNNRFFEGGLVWTDVGETMVALEAMGEGLTGSPVAAMPQNPAGRASESKSQPELKSFDLKSFDMEEGDVEEGEINEDFELDAAVDELIKEAELPLQVSREGAPLARGELEMEDAEIRLEVDDDEEEGAL